MNPDLEDFLQNTFDPVQRSGRSFGRVILKPDYEAELNPADKEQLIAQLIASLEKRHSGEEFEPEQQQFPVLHQYVRLITLKEDAVPEAPWVQVEPAGEWI
jgi:hypothetical protein